MEEILFTGTPQRIDQRLTKQFPYSRNFFHRLMESATITIKSPYRGIFVPKKSYTLQEGDKVCIAAFMRYLDGGILDETPVRAIDIRYETDDYLVLYKPKGVLSHPTSIRNVAVPSVVWGVYHHYKAKTAEQAEKANIPYDNNFIRAGLVHRLDRDTDGFMIIAKTERWLSYFKALFQKKSKMPTKEEKEAVPLHKCYRALCSVTAEWKKFLQKIVDQLPYYIEEVVVPKVPYTVPKVGITKVLDIAMQNWENERTARIDLEILTGRTHQIRCHLSDHGLPVISDTLYGAPVSALEIQLTAWKLEFLDMYWEMKTFIL